MDLGSGGREAKEKVIRPAGESHRGKEDRNAMSHVSITTGPKTVVRIRARRDAFTAAKAVTRLANEQ